MFSPLKRYKTEVIIKKREVIARRYRITSKRGRGIWRKFSAGGCGNARCYLCHGDKLLHRKTIKQKKMDLDFQDQLLEVFSYEQNT